MIRKKYAADQARLSTLFLFEKALVALGRNAPVFLVSNNRNKQRKNNETPWGNNAKSMGTQMKNVGKRK